MKFRKHKAAFDTAKDLTEKEHRKRYEIHFLKHGVGFLEEGFGVCTFQSRKATFLIKSRKSLKFHPFLSDELSNN